MHLIEDAIFNRFENVTLHVFEKEVYIVFILWSYNFFEFHDIAMVQFSK